MKIKELIIEGFKSYQKQVILTEFDPQFNCLTGQNGSGKSNILEAIFFAIGFNFRDQKLSRVKNQRDLIYKRGQSGIQKAKVTIKFCNRDKAKSPVGFENYDDLILERSINSIDNKSKFKFNSVTKNATQIKAIFKSIRLNVDNSSTFFVQQGKVAEIVKFHPSELMKFVEESAGVSYFNSVKEETIRNMELNEPKLQSCIEGVEKLEKEQEARKEEIQIFRQYQNIKQNLKKLNDVKEHYERKQGKEDLLRNAKEIKNLQEEESQLKQQIKQSEILKKNKENEFQKFIREEKNQTNNITNKQQEQLKQELAKIDENINEQKTIVQNLQDKQKRVKQDKIVKQAQKEDKKVLLKTLQQQLQNLKIDEQKNKLEYKDIEQHFNQSKGKQKQQDFLKIKYEQQKQDYQDIQQKLKNEQSRLERLTQNYAQHQESLGKRNNQYEILQKKHEKYLQLQKDLETQHDQLRNNKKQLQDIKNQINDQKSKYLEIEQKIYQNTGQFLNHLDVQNVERIYQKFDKKQFYLKVHNIINVKDPITFNTALETIAGGKLFNYVVRDQNVMTDLVQSRLLRGDIQIIPNNKIIGKQIPLEKVTLAKQIASKMGKEVWLPQELIEYPEDLQNTINYVFQSVFICSDSEIANQICFKEKNLRFPCVTLQGDSYDPQGQLSGGYQQNRVSFLELSQKFKSLKKEQMHIYNQKKINQQKEHQLNDIYDKEKKLKEQIYQNGQKVSDIENKIDQLKLDNIKTQIQTSRTEIKFSEQFIQKFTEQLEQSKILKDQYKNQLSQNRSKNQGDFFGQRLHDLKQILSKLNISIQETEKNIKETQMSIKSLEDDSNNNFNVEESLQQIQQENQTLTNLVQKKEEILKKIDKLTQELFQYQKHLSYIEQKESELQQQIDKLEKQIEEQKGQLLNCKQDIEQKKKSQIELEQIFNSRDRRKRTEQGDMEIEDENTVEETREQIAQKLLETRKEINYLQKQQEEIRKITNFDIEESFKKGDQKLVTFIEQKEETIRNKENLINSMDELTIKSYETVNRCFEKVNENLGKMFGIFLPGMFAKMEMIDVFNKKKNKNEKGIQIRVRIGNKWKESLGELSGGQRTLLALSFLLSLLKYNSAPFYIFDEVDAALDQSNTENLGQIIAQYFSESQFFAISLNENFYKNSNVLFRTSSINGYSTVERINIKEKKRKKRIKKEHIQLNQNLQQVFQLINIYWQTIVSIILLLSQFPWHSKVIYTFYYIKCKYKFFKDSLAFFVKSFPIYQSDFSALNQQLLSSLPKFHFEHKSKINLKILQILQCCQYIDYQQFWELQNWPKSSFKKNLDGKNATEEFFLVSQFYRKNGDRKDHQVHFCYT